MGNNRWNRLSVGSSQQSQFAPVKRLRRGGYVTSRPILKEIGRAAKCPSPVIANPRSGCGNPFFLEKRTDAHASVPAGSE